MTIPTKGRIVHYALSSQDVQSLLYHQVGDVCPAIIVGVHPNNQDVSLQVFLDGPDTLYARFVKQVRAPDLRVEPAVPGLWFWPPGSPSSPIKRGPSHERR